MTLFARSPETHMRSPEKFTISAILQPEHHSLSGPKSSILRDAEALPDVTGEARNEFTGSAVCLCLKRKRQDTQRQKGVCTAS